jgi:molybdopterin converting factor small subunit
MKTNVTISIPTAFRRHTDNLDKFQCSAADLNDVLDALGVRFPELKPHLRDEQGKVRRFLNIYVNDEDIRFLGNDYKFKEGDEVTLVPSIAGG